jgi:hypothetical protein
MQQGLYAALVHCEAARYSGFISYRVATEAQLALDVFAAASGQPLLLTASGEPTREGAVSPGGKVVLYLDRARLVDGMRSRGH